MACDPAVFRWIAAQVRSLQNRVDFLEVRNINDWVGGNRVVDRPVAQQMLPTVLTMVSTSFSLG